MDVVGVGRLGERDWDGKLRSNCKKQQQRGTYFLLNDM